MKWRRVLLFFATGALMIQRLQEVLRAIPAGPVNDTSKLAGTLADAWEQLDEARTQFRGA